MTTITAQTSYQGRLNSHGYLLLDPPPGRNPEELRRYGALRYQGSKTWVMPLRLTDLELMAEDGIYVSLPAEVKAKLLSADRFTRRMQEAKDYEPLSAEPHPKWTTLMPHQHVAAAYLASRDRALLSLVPGLGKTASAIVAADIKDCQRVLVIAPLTLLPTWRREISTWSTDADLSVLTTKTWDLSRRWTITNPEKMNTKAGAQLYDMEWDLIIFDESILYKNQRAKRTKQAQKLANKGDALVWMLSGAPVSAFADDLYGQLSVLRPDLYRSYWRFAEQWCITRKTPWATEIVGNRDPEGLRQHTRDLMLSRTAEDVPGLLPETFFKVVDVELSKSQERLLDRLAGMSWEDDEGETHDITARIAQLTRMSQALSCPRNLGQEETGAKIETLKSLLKDELVQRPTLVWTHYKVTAQTVQRELEAQGYRVGLIYGDTSPEARERVLEGFQDGAVDVLVMQLQTGKFGLSLTEANSVVYVDRSFSYDDWTQSVARVRRLSSKGKVVPTYVLHAGSTDNLVDVILNRKLRSVHDLSLSDLREVLRGRK